MLATLRRKGNFTTETLGRKRNFTTATLGRKVIFYLIMSYMELLFDKKVLYNIKYIYKRI